MKTANFPSLRVDPELRQAAQDVLHEGESLSSFVEQAIRENIDRRQAQAEFLRRGLLSRDLAHAKSGHVAADIVIGKLEERLDRARRTRKPRA